MKDAVKDRTTITLGDSLYGMNGEILVGTPLRNPGVEGYDSLPTAYAARGSKAIDYIEAQIRGGVTVNDIQSVNIHSESTNDRYQEVARLAESSGLQVNWVKRK